MGHEDLFCSTLLEFARGRRGRLDALWLMVRRWGRPEAIPRHSNMNKGQQTEVEGEKKK